MTSTGVFSLAAPYNNNCGNYPSCRQDAEGVVGVVVVIAIVAFVGFLAWAIQQAVAHSRLEKRGTSTTARIVSVEAKGGSRKSNAEVADGLVGRCLARDPSDRPGTEAVLDMLAG